MKQPPRPMGRDDVILRQLDDEWVIYDPLSQELHVLNQTAALVWLYCTGDKTSVDIVAALQRVFEDQVSTDQLASDVDRALEKFHELRLFV
jgi:Coenzyme PQQ synthesis protein D (PqqD)